jgi:hypothetical protein
LLEKYKGNKMYGFVRITNEREAIGRAIVVASTTFALQARALRFSPVSDNSARQRVKGIFFSSSSLGIALFLRCFCPYLLLLPYRLNETHGMLWASSYV